MWSFIKAAAVTLSRTVILPYLLSKVIVTTIDKNRAGTAEVIARAAANQVLSEYPEAEWAQLVNLVISTIGDGLDFEPPAGALRRMAIAALREAGAKPS